MLLALLSNGGGSAPPPTPDPGNPPLIYTDLPAATTGFHGYGASLQPEIYGATSYQWHKNGAVLTGQTGIKLNFNPVAGDTYFLRATNANGSVDTTTTTISVRAGVALDWITQFPPIITEAENLCKAVFKTDGTVEFYADGVLVNTDRWLTVGSPAISIAEYRIDVGVLNVMPAAFSTTASTYKMYTSTLMSTNGYIEIDIADVTTDPLFQNPATGNDVYVAYLNVGIFDALHPDEFFNGNNESAFGIKKAGTP